MPDECRPPRVIYLEPLCCPDPDTGPLWCSDDVWTGEYCNAPKCCRPDRKKVAARYVIAEPPADD